MPTKKEKKIAVRADNKRKPLMGPKVHEEEEAKERRRHREQRHEAMIRFTTAYEARKRYDWEWLTRDLYRRGYQFSRYNPSNRTVILSSRAMVKIPVNLMWAQMRAVKNQVTSFRPKWETVPIGKSEEAVTNARYSGKLLDYYYERLGLRKMIKETVIQGLMYSVGGPWQIGYDPDADNGNGEVHIWLLDPFDFFIDPKATKMEEAEYCIKAVRRPLDEVKHNPNYHFYERVEHGEEREAASEYKQFLLQALKYQASYTENQENVILKECWMKIRVDDENKDDLIKELKENDQDVDDLRYGEVLMRVTTYLDFVTDPLRSQLLRRSDFPFELYQADINPMEIYGESWAKHIIPMNRVLNALESSTFEYNYKYGKGRIVIDKNSGVRIISNEHGDIIEKNQGSEVTSLGLQPLPASYQNQILNMQDYIKTIGGAQDISLGKVPPGVKSGVGIAELKQADATNQGDLVDNLEDFLVKVGKKVLAEIADNYDIPKVIMALGKKGNPDHFAVVGEKGSKNRRNKKQIKVGVDQFDIAVIGRDNEIKVKIGSWLAYTKEAMNQKLQELFQVGLINQETFLEHAEFNDVENIISKTREEELLKKFRGAPAQGTEVGDEEIAAQENIQMVREGKSPPVQPQDNHIVHNIVHQEHADHPIVSEHMQDHEVMQRTQKGLPEQTPEPQQPLGMGTPPPPQVGPAAGPTGAPPAPQSAITPTPGGGGPQQALQRNLQEVLGGG